MFSKKFFGIIAIALVGLVIGIILFFIQHGILHVSFTGFSSSYNKAAFNKPESLQKRKILLYCWKEGKWQENETTILWKEEDIAKSMKHLINSWITYVQDEQLIDYALSLKQVAFSSQYNELYVSFNRTLFYQEWSITEKMLFVEGLLKTIRKTTRLPQAIVFLLNEKYMPDDRHLILY